MVDFDRINCRRRGNDPFEDRGSVKGGRQRQRQRERERERLGPGA